MMAWLVANWRDAILIVVGLLGIYMVLSVMRLVQVGRSTARLNANIAPPPGYGEPMIDLSQNMPTDALRQSYVEPVLAYQANDEYEPPANSAAPAAVAEPEPQEASLLSRLGRWAHPQAPVAAPTTSATDSDFASELRQSNLEVEVQQLRRESELLREQLATVHEELSLLKSARNVSPLYSEAASLAQKGVPADGIAGQCGISLGEAELVAALARADGRSGRVEPTLDTGENGHGGFPHRRARTGTHG